MKDIIINQPHLQSLKQRLGSLFLSLLSWLLWLYFLLPLFTLGGWLLGVKSLSDEIRWFGGYKTLLQLLEMYGSIIAVIAIGWTVWSLCLSWIHAIKHKKILPVVDDRQLCEAYHVSLEQLADARTNRKVTVHFDNHAVITQLESARNNS